MTEQQTPKIDPRYLMNPLNAVVASWFEPGGWLEELARLDQAEPKKQKQPKTQKHSDRYAVMRKYSDRAQNENLVNKKEGE